MPIISFEGGTMDTEKKKALVKELTDAAAKVTGIRREAFTIVIHENSLDNIGVGGDLLREYMEKQKNK